MHIPKINQPSVSKYIPAAIVRARIASIVCDTCDLLYAMSSHLCVVEHDLFDLCVNRMIAVAAQARQSLLVSGCRLRCICARNAKRRGTALSSVW